MNNENEFWKSLFSPKGRNNRGRFWLVAILSWFVTIFGSLCIGFVAGLLGQGDNALFFALPLIALMFVVGLFNRIKRLHDLGFSGWWMLLITALEMPLLVFANLPTGEGAEPNIGKGLYALFTLEMVAVFGGFQGQPGPNRFGDPPGRIVPAEQPA